MATNGNSQHYANQFGSTQQGSNAFPGGSSVPDQSASPANNNLGKDEVAWFFVEQYYTTLSKSPEKLHLFYSKRSQFVYGQEAEVAEVSVGRQNIQERIKALDLQDTCKVRISNVDSQSSYDNIVIQVIGETSNKVGDDPKKFLQTFVLAQQPSGYFVLNDILRYLDDEGEEDQGELADQEAAVELPASGAPAESHEEPEIKTDSVAEEDTPVSSFDASVVSQKLEEVSANAKDGASVNGESPADAPAELAAAPVPEPAAAAETEPVPDAEETIQKLEEEDTTEPEKPADPTPTPVATRAPPAQPATPAQPPKPMTWASRAAAAAGPPRPAVPLAKTATPAAAAQSRPAAAQGPGPAAAASQPAKPQATPTTPAAASKESTEWQTAGSDHKRQNRPQSISGNQAEKDGTLGYVKYVTEKVNQEDLKAALAQHGELVYFDINRTKSCAFVEFATPAGYQAAAAANPHVVNGESITIEPRRPKQGAYGGANFSAGRGGNVPSRGGRGGFEGGRTGSQGGRGNFSGQNRGRGGGVARGRGASQAAA